MPQRPELECDEADQQAAEGDQGWQPAAGASDRQGGDDEGVGEEEGSGQHRANRRPPRLSTVGALRAHPWEDRSAGARA